MRFERNTTFIKLSTQHNPPFLFWALNIIPIPPFYTLFYSLIFSGFFPLRQLIGGRHQELPPCGENEKEVRLNSTERHKHGDAHVLEARERGWGRTNCQCHHGGKSWENPRRVLSRDGRAWLAWWQRDGDGDYGGYDGTGLQVNGIMGAESCRHSLVPKSPSHHYMQG